MSIIIIVDTETTSADRETCSVIEAAGVAYHLEHASVVDVWSGVAATEHEDDWGAEHIHGISWQLAASSGRDEDALVGDFFGWVHEYAREPILLAHNASFDREVLFWAADRAGVSPITPEHRWVCTYEDFAWPKGSGKLVEVALNHGVGVVQAHRALDDCLTLARTLTRVAETGHDLRALVREATLPRAVVRAHVSFDDRHLAKAQGFRWDGDRRVWHKRVRADLVDQLAEEWGFPLTVLSREVRDAA